MTPLFFEWDKQKNKTNQKKHSVSFQEAESVFYDENAIQFWDDNYLEIGYWFSLVLELKRLPEENLIEKAQGIFTLKRHIAMLN